MEDFWASEREEIVQLDRGSYTTCAVNLFGATIVSWRITNTEQLFSSSRNVFDDVVPTRGGIPVIFPQSGPWVFGPHNGFARIMKWKLAKAPNRLLTGDVEAVFSLADDEFTKSMWNYSFRLEYRVVLQDKGLDLRVKIVNTSVRCTINVNCALHTYFKVPDVNLCKIAGLGDAEFIDKNRDWETYTTESPILKVTSCMDRIYKNTKCAHILSVGNKWVKIEKVNFPDTLIWNPGIEENISELDKAEYQKLLCIVAGYMARYAKLAPGETLICHLTLKQQQ